jgi:hypothetical protein
MASPASRVADALAAFRQPVEVILTDGDDPREVLALGVLVRWSAPEEVDLGRMHDTLAVHACRGRRRGRLPDHRSGRRRPRRQTRCHVGTQDLIGEA